MHFPFKLMDNTTEAHTSLSTLVNVVCNNIIDDFMRYSDNCADCHFSIKENEASLLATADTFDEAQFLIVLDRHFDCLLDSSYVEHYAVEQGLSYPWSCGITGHGVTCDILYFKGTLKIKLEARPDMMEAK